MRLFRLFFLRPPGFRGSGASAAGSAAAAAFSSLSFASLFFAASASASASAFVLARALSCARLSPSGDKSSKASNRNRTPFRSCRVNSGCQKRTIRTYRSISSLSL